ncbi:MAG: TRAP transporter substrate-binding protein, partial [Planctomycetota bacterium]
GGRLVIEVSGGGKLVPGLQIFDAVRDGLVQMGHSAAYFWDGKAGEALRASPFFTAVPFGLSARATYAWLASGGQALWDELYAPFGVMALPLGNTGVQAGGWFRSPIETLDDLKGLNMRMPGLGGKVLTRAGGRAETLPAKEIRTALGTGRIDATEWIGPYHDYQRGFYEVAPYYYVGGWHEPGSILELLINKAAWDELGNDLQGIVRATAAEIDRRMEAQWLAKDVEYFAKMQADPAIHVAPYPLAVAAGLRDHARAVLAEVRATSKLAERIHDSYFAFHRQWQAYVGAADHTFFAALSHD